MKDKKELSYAEKIDLIRRTVPIETVADMFYTVTATKGKYKNKAFPKELRVATKTLSTLEHDSLVIFRENNTFFRYSTGDHGDVLNFCFLMPEIKWNYAKAVEELMPFTNPELTKTFPQKKEEMIGTRIKRLKENVIKTARNYGCSQFAYDMQKFFKDSTSENLDYIEKTTKSFYSNDIFEKNPKYKWDKYANNAMAYLIQKRKINPNLVKMLVGDDFIRQRSFKNKKYVAFIQKNEYGNVEGVSLRGCNYLSENSKFNKLEDSHNCNMGWTLDFEPEKSEKVLVVFEGCIDMLSFITTQYNNKQDLSNFKYLALGGAGKSSVVMNHVAYQSYKEVWIALDNDKAGKQVSDSLKKRLAEIGVQSRRLMPVTKDWNQDLVEEKPFKYVNPKIFEEVEFKKKELQMEGPEI